MTEKLALFFHPCVSLQLLRGIYILLAIQPIGKIKHNVYGTRNQPKTSDCCCLSVYK